MSNNNGEKGLKVALIQTRLKEELKESFEALSLSFMGLPEDIDVIVLPESWHVVGIIKKVEELIDKYNDIIDFLSEKASEANSFVIGGATYKEEDGERFIVSPIFSPEGKLLGEQYKIELFEIEKEYFNTKPEFIILKIRGYKIGTMICYDANFPEIARILVRNGVDLIANPSRIIAGGEEMWHLYLATRTLENRIPIVGVNVFYPGQYNGNSIAFYPEKTHLGIVKPRIIEHLGKGEAVKTISINLDPPRGLRRRRIKEFEKLVDLEKKSKINVVGE